MLPNSLNKSNVVIINWIKTWQKYSPASPMNNDSNSLNEVLTNWTPQKIKRSFHHDQAGFTPGMQGWFNTCKTVNALHPMCKFRHRYHMVFSIRKNLWQNSLPFHNKIPEETRNRGTHLNIKRLGMSQGDGSESTNTCCANTTTWVWIPTAIVKSWLW